MQFLVDASVDHDVFTLSLFIALPDYQYNSKSPARHYLSDNNVRKLPINGA